MGKPPQPTPGYMSVGLLWLHVWVVVLSIFAFQPANGQRSRLCSLTQRSTPASPHHLPTLVHTFSHQPAGAAHSKVVLSYTNTEIFEQLCSDSTFLHAHHQRKANRLTQRQLRKTDSQVQAWLELCPTAICLFNKSDIQRHYNKDKKAPILKNSIASNRCTLCTLDNKETAGVHTTSSSSLVPAFSRSMHTQHTGFAYLAKHLFQPNLRM